MVAGLFIDCSAHRLSFNKISIEKNIYPFVGGCCFSITNRLGLLDQHRLFQILMFYIMLRSILRMGTMDLWKIPIFKSGPIK